MRALGRTAAAFLAAFLATLGLAFGALMNAGNNFFYSLFGLR